MESDALTRLLPLVSARTGLIRTLSPIPRSALEPSNVFLYQAGLALRLRLQVVEQTVIETAARCLKAEHTGSRDEEGGAAYSALLQKFATVHGISDLIR